MRTLPLLLLLACTRAVTAPDDVADDLDTDAPSPARSDATDAPVDSDGDTDVVDTDPGPPPSFEACMAPLWGGVLPPMYAGFDPPMGRHCVGTNHQDIRDVERVVVIGDSIAVGTPPTLVADWWRNRLADALVPRFGLEAPSWGWRNANYVDGMALETFSGSFAACAKYGARTDDPLLDPHRQIETCIPEEERDKTTLVLITMGGNDIYSLLEDVRDGVDEATILETFDRAARLMREAVAWLVEPGRFPNGVYVVFANIYDFSDPDGAEDMARCEGAQLIGMSPPLRDPVFQQAIANAQRAYLQTAVDTGADLLFLGELFCGHGYNRDARTGRCYRGANAPLYLDFTCEHPNANGHAALAEAFLDVIAE